MQQSTHTDSPDKPGDSRLITYLNPYSYTIARHELDLLESMDEIRLDGMMLCWCVNACIKSGVIRRSFDNTSDAPHVFSACQLQGKRVYIIGSTKDSVAQFVHSLKKAFPRIILAGYRHGYFEDDHEKVRAINDIYTAGADVVIAGMGILRQEQFLLALKAAGWRGEGYTCGGFIHQADESMVYFPPWIDRLNLRLFWRIYREPHFRPRLINYLIFLCVFPLDWWRDYLGRRSLVTVLRLRCR